MDYENARKIIHSLAEGAARRENERNARDIEAEYDDADLKAEGKAGEARRDREEAADLQSAVEVFGDLAVDIAQSLNRIANRGSGHIQ